MQVDEKIPFKRAIFFVLLSVIVIWGISLVSWLVHKRLLYIRQNDPHFKIVAIAQTSPRSELLKSRHLAELLNLSRDQPQNLYAFDPQAAVRLLQSCQIFDHVACHRLRPGIVHIDYTLKEPFVSLSDFDNMAMDKEARLFPMQPYLSPKKLPEIFVGIKEMPNIQLPLVAKEVTLAIHILEYIQTCFPKEIQTIRIDTHAAYDPRRGQREVVIVLKDGVTRYLRLQGDGFKKTLGHYQKLRETIAKLEKDGSEQVIDLRCPNIALVI